MLAQTKKHKFVENLKVKHETGIKIFHKISLKCLSSLEEVETTVVEDLVQEEDVVLSVVEEEAEMEDLQDLQAS